jgi:hypothetical protein
MARKTNQQRLIRPLSTRDTATTKELLQLMTKHGDKPVSWVAAV